MLGLGNSITGGAALSEVLPSDISNLAMWLKNNTGITSDGGSPDLVSQWDDSSGNGRHVTQSTDDDKATKVDGGIDMSGADPEDHYPITESGGFVDIGGSNGYTLAFVGKREGTDTDDNALLGGSANSEFIIIADEETIMTRTTGGSAAISTFVFATDTWVINTQMLITVTKDTSGNFKFYKNGTEVSPSSTTNPTNTGNFEVEYLGSRPVGDATSDFTWDGVIYEVAFYNATLAGSDLTNLNSYLTGKFGL